MSLDGKGGSRALATTATALWLLRENGSLNRLDASTRALTTIPLDAPATAVSIGADAAAPDVACALDQQTSWADAVDPLFTELGGTPAKKKSRTPEDFDLMLADLAMPD